MCGDRRDRKQLVLVIASGAPTAYTINQLPTLNLVELELVAFSLTGVPVTAGVPYTPFVVVALNGGTFNSRTLIVNQDQPVAGAAGYALQVESASTIYQYETPAVIAHNDSGGMAGISSRFLVEVRDAGNLQAQFTQLVLFCNAVYSTEPLPPIVRGASFASHVVTAPHLPMALAGWPNWIQP